MLLASLVGMSLAVLSSPAPAEGGVGTVQPRVQYELPNTHTRVGVAPPMATPVDTAAGVGVRVLRPFAFVTGRF